MSPSPGPNTPGLSGVYLSWPLHTVSYDRTGSCHIILGFCIEDMWVSIYVSLDSVRDRIQRLKRVVAVWGERCMGLTVDIMALRSVHVNSGPVSPTEDKAGGGG